MEIHMSSIKIDNDVPLPDMSYLPKIPLSDMKVGNSILLKKMDARKLQALRARITRFYRKHPYHQFSVRKEEDAKSGTYRLFRLKDRPTNQ